MPRRVRSAYELCQASEHVVYEIERLFGTLVDIGTIHHAHHAGETPSPWTRDALVESWTIHLRNTMHFLHSTYARTDDIVAADFFLGDGVWADLLPDPHLTPDTEAMLDRRINKEIVHLTYARTKVTPEQKQWQLGPITYALRDPLWTFASRVPAAHVERNFEMRISRALHSVA